QPRQDSRAEAYRAEPARPVLTDPIRPAAVIEQPAPAAAPVPRQANEGEGRGWLRDVLRNASANQAGGQPQQALSGLSEEIARAIDDAALAEAWARYQAGESNVFTRRIYTLTGQGTY